MKLIFTGQRFEFRCRYEDRGVAQALKIPFDLKEKCFYTKSLEKASRLVPYGDESVLKIFKNRLIQVDHDRGALPLVVPEKEKLRAYQHKMGAWALTRNRSYIAADAGLGKTPTAACITNSDPGRVVYLTPPGLRFNVEIEFRRWITWTKNIRVVAGSNESFAWGGDVVIMPDSLIARAHIKRALREIRPKWFFIDEAQRFGRDSERSTALYGLHKTPSISLEAENIVSMSGTPINARPRELYLNLITFAPEVIGFKNFRTFAMRYCGAYYDEEKGKMNYDGASNLKEFHDALYEKYMIRFRKRDVLTELPDKEVQCVYLDAEPSQAVKAFEQGLLKELRSIGKVIKHLMEAFDGNIPTYRKQMGLDIVHRAAEFIEEQVENSDENFLIFAHHKEVIRILLDKFKAYKPLSIVGGVESGERMEIVQRFQRGDTRLFFGNIAACGTGLTLTRATRVIFVEFDWHPKPNEQAEDRAHRFGQKNAVLVQYLLLKNSLFEYILKGNLEKSKTINTLIEGERQ